MRKEVSGLFNFFQENVGEVVDMNLDYFPDMIIVSFVNHKDVVTALEKRIPGSTKYQHRYLTPANGNLM